jgi:hypothetical protein
MDAYAIKKSPEDFRKPGLFDDDLIDNSISVPLKLGRY